MTSRVLFVIFGWALWMEEWNDPWGNDYVWTHVYDRTKEELNGE